ncbi:hypothetical protein PM082_010391 [Marasmius tenuissimus]|nr:hypothetical protein PM082_010391 [Marasmius tenuissimus]
MIDACEALACTANGWKGTVGALTKGAALYNTTTIFNPEYQALSSKYLVKASSFALLKCW